MAHQTVRYAKSGDINVAYEVSGRGGRDLVLVAGFVSHLAHDWLHPGYAHFLTRLAAFSRLIRFDKRGTGLSDRPGGLPDLETRMDDVRAVMDAAHSHSATIFGYSEGGPMAILFAATFPERTDALVIYGSYARRLVADDYPWGQTVEGRARYAEQIEAEWGWEADMHTMCPTADEATAAWWGERARAAASPGAARALIEMNSLADVRPILGSIRVPTLVMHRTGDHDSRVEEGRYIAENIPGARFVELDGVDHFPAIDPDQIVDEVELFVTGRLAPVRADRRLATILFADIVDSTGRVRTTGNETWAQVLARFVEAARTHLDAEQGRLVKTTGDGLVATFEGPARALRCGCAIRDTSRELGLEVRVGVHSAEIEERDGDIVGVGVHVAARICQVARGGEVWTSRTVRDLVAGSGIGFLERGDWTLKGFSESTALFAAAA